MSKKKARDEEGSDRIRCAGCQTWGENAGYVLLKAAGEAWDRVGPLCFDCMRWVQAQMRRTARPDRVDEIRVMGSEQ